MIPLSFKEEYSPQVKFRNLSCLCKIVNAVLKATDVDNAYYSFRTSFRSKMNLIFPVKEYASKYMKRTWITQKIKIPVKEGNIMRMLLLEEFLTL